MELISDILKKCSVKIIAEVSAVPSYGTGIIYQTPDFCNYNYVLTAKHIFQEDIDTPFKLKSLDNIDILISDEKKLKRLQFIKKKEIDERLIYFDEDFAIIIIDKKKEFVFSDIFVVDKEELDVKDLNFFSWAIFSANLNSIHKFDFERNDNSIKRYKLKEPPTYDALKGMSGAGIFVKDKNKLIGVISNYPNEKFGNNTIDCSDISFADVNSKLLSLKRVPLDTESSRHKREINNLVVDIHQATINNVSLNLELARKRLKTDIIDDWFHDPLKYIDLLNQEYLFEQFKDYFLQDNYKPALAELFYVPKKSLTLRQALLLPFRDRIMYMAIVGVLAEVIDNSMIPNVYSARFNRFSQDQLIINGVEQWKKMQYIIEETAFLKNTDDTFKYNCIIEIDLLNFYDNINKELLIRKLQRVCTNDNEKNACILLDSFLKNISKNNAGLPQNSDASSLLASFYLNQVDNFIQSKSFSYFRFMDDIRIFCNNKYEARKILQSFEYELKRCNLSVNSQKTQILTIIDDENKTLNLNEIYRNKPVLNKCNIDVKKLNVHFDFEINKIVSLRKSDNYENRNDAFHQSLKLLENNLDTDLNGSDDSARKLNLSLNTIEILVKKDLTLCSSNSSIVTSLIKVVDSLIDKPWITTQVCKVLNLIPTNDIDSKIIESLRKIILEDDYNTYSFQTYQIWLLFAKLKYKCSLLKKYAVESIEKNDETNRPVIAAMILYVCSVDNNYMRVISRKFDEKFTHGYFQNRIALISLRSIDTLLIDEKSIDKSLLYSHSFTSKFKDKDLVYIQGFDESDDYKNDDMFEQLYSI